MRNIKFKPSGVCCREMDIVLTDDNVIEDIKFIGGCPGNTLGVRALAIGRKADEVAAKFENIKCGSKNTSCPAQLAIALTE